MSGSKKIFDFLKGKIRSYIYRDKTLGNSILNLFHFLMFNKVVDFFVISIKFKQRFGFFPNIIKPRTFNEKIQWIKLNYMDEDKAKYVDKFLVRGFVRETIGEKYLIPLIFHTEKLDDLTEQTITSRPCVIKTNHASGHVHFVNKQQGYDLKKIKQKLLFQLRQNFYHVSREKQYKHITPLIIIEELLLTEDEKIPDDIKIHCFNGSPKFIQVDSSRFEDHRRNLYDINWNQLHYKWHKDEGLGIPKPSNLVEIINLSKKLSKLFIFARIDFYILKNKIYFGEITFTPASGLEKFESIDIDFKWGKELQLR